MKKIKLLVFSSFMFLAILPISAYSVGPGTMTTGTTVAGTYATFTASLSNGTYYTKAFAKGTKNSYVYVETLTTVRRDTNSQIYTTGAENKNLSTSASGTLYSHSYNSNLIQ